MKKQHALDNLLDPQTNKKVGRRPSEDPKLVRSFRLSDSKYGLIKKLGNGSPQKGLNKLVSSLEALDIVSLKPSED